MNAQPGTLARKHGGLRRGPLVLGVAVIALIAAIAIDTTVVSLDAPGTAADAGFSAATYGPAEFPKIRALIEEKAVDAPTLAAALVADKAAASKQYGVNAGGASVMSVRFTGVVGEGKAGNYAVAVPGMPEGVGVRVQTGPAVNGTDLRDATGTIAFGQFTNQIEYQDAGSSLNNAMKEAVLADLDRAALTGKTVTVVGAFRLVNPKNWLVTPVTLDVQ